MLYTILSLDDVLLPPESAVPALEMVQRGPRVFEGVQGKDGFVISRMISTNPADYLEASYSPGCRLK